MKRMLAVTAMLATTLVQAQTQQPKLGKKTAPIIQQDGLSFKDLNRNGKLDPYEDWRLTAAERAKDLVSQMTVEEKAGAMMHATAPAAGQVGMGGTYDAAEAERMIRDKWVNTFITRLSGKAHDIAHENNRLQEIAERQRLGIPVTISTDPRNHFHFTVGATVSSADFSKWPEPLGLAAIGDAALVKKFGDIVRQEYLAVGIREALSPQADIATEPRWSRIDGTFGDDPELTRQMVEAYVEGFQNGADGINAGSVVTVVKHWVGYGAQKNGFDSHNAYGRFGHFTGDHLPLHVIPFLGAFAAHTGGVMPTYSIPEGGTLDGAPLEQVGAGYSKQLLGALRNKYGFDGVIVSDWGITKDCDAVCTNGFPSGQKLDFSHIGMPWGVETLNAEDRYAKTINAGVDQVGGTDDSKSVIAAVRAGKISEARLNDAATRILIQKFQQGLFEDPYTDEERAGEVVGNAKFLEAAADAQRRSMVLLENKGGVLPLKADGKRVFLYHVDEKLAAKYGMTVVKTPAEADFALLRVTAPYETLHPGYRFGSMQHEGSLDFKDGDAEWAVIRDAAAKTTTIVTVYLDRPAILTRVKEKAAAILGNFGVSDEALLDVVTGRAKPEGKLPFELPSSMAEVEAQASDLPHDTKHPLYGFGFGMSY